MYGGTEKSDGPAADIFIRVSQISISSNANRSETNFDITTSHIHHTFASRNNLIYLSSRTCPKERKVKRT